MIWRTLCLISFPHITKICINKIYMLLLINKGMLHHPYNNTMARMKRNYFRISQINIMCRKTIPQSPNLMILKFHSQAEMIFLIVLKSVKNMIVQEN